MKISVIGGTGFIGGYIVKELLLKGYDVIVTGTNLQKAKEKDWFTKVDFIELEIGKIQSIEVMKKIASSDILINLAWKGLPNYSELFHFEKNLMPQYFFLKELVELGLKNITIIGTCLEYGMRNGCLNVEMVSDPQNPYSLAKDTLRKFLQLLQTKKNYNLKWVRLFYVYGNGQSDNSILSQLEKALENGDKMFNMSGGEQLRDYLPVNEAAKQIIEIALKDNNGGIYNVCSGSPISIRKLVENYLIKKNKHIILNYGYYPYPKHEPMAFWGDNSKKIQKK